MKTLLNTFKRIFVALQLALIASVLTSAVRAAGEVDTTFNSAVQETTQGSVQTIVTQSDGKLLVGGNFTVADNAGRSNVARLNADGTIDPTFNPPDFYKLIPPFGAVSVKDVFIYAIAVQSDGKILVGGDFSGVNNQPARGVVRLNADGSLDTSFNVPSFQNVAFLVYDIKIQNDNRIILAGDFILRQPGSTDFYNLARVNLDGSIDTSFQVNPEPNYLAVSQVRSVLIQPDGKIIFPGNSQSGAAIRRVNPDGTLDTSFTSASVSGVNELTLQPDGKILVGGRFSTVNGFPQNNVSRLNSNGSIDTTFNVNGTGASAQVNGIDVLPGGKIVVVGEFSTFNSVSRSKNVRLNNDGSLDTSFNYNPGGTSVIYAVKSLGDGRVIIGGSDTSGNWDKLVRLNADGSQDSTFVGAIYQRGTVAKVLTQPDGKVLLAGSFKKVNGIIRQNFARLNQDGSVDTTFTANANGGGYTIALQSDGKILISGAYTTINGNSRPYLTRLTSDGVTDPSFQPVLTLNGLVNEIAVLSDGKIIIAGGGFGSVAVARLNSNGSEDTTFTKTSVTASGGIVSPSVSALKIQTDGKIVIGGSFTQLNGINRGRVARLNADGTLDTTFNPPLGANNDVYDLAIQSNGNIVIGGLFNGVNGVNNQYYLARLFTDGTLDTTFNPAPNATVFAVEVQADNKILIGGLFNAVTGISHYNLARINSNGTLDNSFGGIGANDIVRNIYAQPDGKILVGGEFTRINGISRVGVARLLNATAAARTRYDFDGDGRADVSLFRPSTGSWYILPSQTGGFYGFPFGASDDVITPADYDGDGKTDVAVWRRPVPAPGGGTGDKSYFYILNSSNNTFRPEQFGIGLDVPVVGDWDGDGKADLAVYRYGSNAQGNFYYRPSSEPSVDYRTITWGGPNDQPLVGDFDGDGRIDPAVHSGANWVILKSSDNQTMQVNFGLSTDIPVPADYNGDGTTDIAVFRPSTGYWYTSTNPATNYGAIQFGQNGDLPVPADYDGDGRTDVAVFRGSNGAWYINRTTSGFYGVQFGVAGDKPAPNAFIR